MTHTRPVPRETGHPQADTKCLSVIVVIHLMLVLALIGTVLLQKSEGGGLVSTTSGGFLSSRGTANVLSRTTALLATGFFVTSLALSWLAGLNRHPASIINTGAPASQAPGAPPVAPLNQGSGGVLNQLQQGIPGLPSGSNPALAPPPAPAAPSGPQVPQSK